MFLPRFQSFTVIANRYATLWTLCGTIKKQILTCLRIVAYHIRLTARFFHLIERPQFSAMGIQLRFYPIPFDSLMTVHMFIKAGF